MSPALQTKTRGDIRNKNHKIIRRFRLIQNFTKALIQFTSDKSFRRNEHPYIWRKLINRDSRVNECGQSQTNNIAHGFGGLVLEDLSVTSQYDVKCQQKTRGGFPLIDFTKNRKPKSPCAKEYFLDIYIYFTFISFHLFGKILALVLEKELSRLYRWNWKLFGWGLVKTEHKSANILVGKIDCLGSFWNEPYVGL